MNKEITMENAEYFREKILNMRQRLHAMEGFERVENISENVPEPTPEIKSVIFSNKEKENHEK